MAIQNTTQILTEFQEIWQKKITAHLLPLLELVQQHK